MSCWFTLLWLMLWMGCLDIKLKMLQFVRQGALLHADEVAAGVVTGEARHGKLIIGVHVLDLISLNRDA